MKGIVVLVVLVFLAGITSGTIPDSAENLIQNGGFDDGLDNWVQSNSANMTINASEGYCNMSTIHTDWISEHNYTTLQYGSYYDTSLVNGTQYRPPPSSSPATTRTDWWDYVKIDDGKDNGSYTSKIYYCNEARNPPLTGDYVNYTPYYANWLYIVVGGYNITAPDVGWYNEYTPYVRTGLSPTIDGTWSLWQSTSRLATGGMSGLTQSFWGINSPNSLYMQYKIEFHDDNYTLYVTDTGLVPTIETYEWAEISQEFLKPNTEYTYLTYKYNVTNLNNTKEVYLYAKLNDEIVGFHNISANTSDWITIITNISNYSYGNYNLTFYLFDGFNSSNGSATVWLDDVGIWVTYTTSQEIINLLILIIPLIIILLIIRKWLIGINDVTEGWMK